MSIIIWENLVCIISIYNIIDVHILLNVIYVLKGGY